MIVISVNTSLVSFRVLVSARYFPLAVLSCCLLRLDFHQITNICLGTPNQAILSPSCFGVTYGDVDVGSAPSRPLGTMHVPYRAQAGDHFSRLTGKRQQFVSISNMREFRDKNVEELLFEDLLGLPSSARVG